MAALTGLSLAGRLDTLGDRKAGLSRRALQFNQLDTRHLHMEVDSVEQRSRNAVAIALDLERGAAAFVPWVAEVTTGTRIHRRQQGEASGKGKPAPGADDGKPAFLQRLSQGLERVTLELGKLIQKEDAVVSQADFSGPRYTTTSHHRHRADTGVGAAKRPPPDESCGRLFGGQRVNLGDGDRLRAAQHGQDPGKPPRQHGLTRTRWPHEERVMTTGGSDLQGSLGAFLSTNIGEVEGARSCCRRRLGWRGRQQGGDSHQMLDRLGEPGKAKDGDYLESGSLGGIGHR
jgi:hypothetical protein